MVFKVNVKQSYSKRYYELFKKKGMEFATWDSIWWVPMFRVRVRVWVRLTLTITLNLTQLLP